MGRISSRLPEYENPPVNEVVFGIQFNKLQNLKAPHIGILWEKLGRKEYPECKEVNPISHTVESFNGPQSKTITLEGFTLPPLPRIFFINEINNHLIQVQEDRLHQNWRKIKSDDEYPSYVELYPKFMESWELFKSFLDDMELGSVEPDQYELTYVNYINRGQGWVDLNNINGIFRDFQSKKEDCFLPEPEDISWRKIYRMPDDIGRLHVSMRTGISRESKDRIIILDLTARGFIPNEIKKWFDMAHEWIVKGFTDLTSESIQKDIWKRKQ